MNSTSARNFLSRRRSVASIHLFRRDDKEPYRGDQYRSARPGVHARLHPRSGPDGIPGTFDDQRLTVYAQNPATLGQDRYLLTNPAGLRMLNTGVLAEAGADWRRCDGSRVLRGGEIIRTHQPGQRGL